MKYKNIRGSADFGNIRNFARNFGALDAGGAEEDGGYRAAKEDEEKEKTKTAEGDLMSAISGGVMGSMGSLCECAGKDKAAENAKKEELAKKYPMRDCGAHPTQECLAYNEKQQELRDKEFTSWEKMKDAEVASNMTPSDQARFAFVKELAEKLKAKHPEAGGMTLAQIYRQYPDDFDAVYKELQAQFPFLKNIDAATALAMNPGISSLTLDQLIAKTKAISGGTSSTGTKASGSGGAIAGAAVVGSMLLGLLLFTRRK